MIFLKGDIIPPIFRNCFTYTRSFSINPYIKAGYQATTKREIWKRIKDKGEDYGFRVTIETKITLYA
jgi:hypothetical protein